jgi:chromosome segregation ATPase
MGLFDKRDKTKGRRDDFDSPVESVDLNGALDEPAGAEASAPAPRTAVAAAPAAAPGRTRAPSESEADAAGFGIDKAIQLMRTLPTDNIELVVQVVKLTLESTRIKISTIIDDASRRQEDIQGRIKVLKEEIAEFEKEIAQRREEIGGLEADFAETSTVKDRLQLAEKLTTKSHPPITSGGKDQAAAAGAIGGPAPLPGMPSPSPAPSPGLPRPSGTLPAASPSGSHTVVAKK